MTNNPMPAEGAAPAKLLRAKELLWEQEEFRMLPSRYWSVANRLLDLVDPTQPAAWITVPVGMVAKELGKTLHHIRDGLSWLQDNGYANCELGDDLARIQLRDAFIEPLGLAAGTAS
ncbi:hypothetical protein QU487_06790 [Crenobacter sp. SG2305]|uniref:hypothetical protein n=1 Tax=Crenobacter oryzisoli TaxID=3056844 RepID=UPI0025AA5C82|nr:hypothetical protein [Crenobacter sp. SG2305]MDN0082461.1 hypothetical protein [Crenobacter sp. SG2305]